ncbi:MAG: RHS repeat protein, partial [Candidatus Symbiothrix sp.]|nr:RHS repeat protein [Candidatus Symbiothrix sp.]
MRKQKILLQLISLLPGVPGILPTPQRLRSSRNLFIMLFCLLGLSQAFGQAAQDDNRFIPPSPTVAELGKYGMIPVGHYTGVPNISVPLYTIECGSLKLPLTLSYHAGGIKVEQIASWVGLGWSLNAGGIINASIIGTADFGGRFEIDPGLAEAPEVDDTAHISLPNKPSKDMLDALAEGAFDSQPDIFTYSFNGQSGQFVFDLDRTARDIRNNKQLKISKEEHEFTITDDFGTVYEFNDREITTIYSYLRGFDATAGTINASVLSGQNRTVNCTAWFLTRMISANRQDTLQFIYDEEIQGYETKIEGKIHYAFYGNSGWNSRSDEIVKRNDHLSSLKVINETKRLSRIEGNNGLKIDLLANTVRQDLSGSHRLDQIKIAFNNELIKQWDLDYTYFESYITSSPDRLYLTTPQDTLLNKRLRLSGIREDQLKTWNFRYYGDDPGEPQLPYRTAFYGSDYWGYCNDSVTVQEANNLKKIFPKIDTTLTVTPSPTIFANYDIPMTIRYSGSNKYPNPNYTHAYTLKSISYPTGGYSEFVYEPNDYSMIRNLVKNDDKLCGGLRIKEIQNYSSDGILATKNTYQYQMLSNDMTTTLNKSSGSVINEFRAIMETPYLEYVEGANDCLICWYPLWNMKSDFELSSSSYSSMYSYGGEFIGYSYVTEMNENGSTRYNFYSINDFSYQNVSYYMEFFGYHDEVENISSSLRDLGYEYPFSSSFWGKSYGRGLLKNKCIFNANNHKLYSEKNTYEFTDIIKILGWEIVKMREIVYPDTWPLGINHLANGYAHQIGQALLTEKEIFNYDQNGENPITALHIYQYNDNNQLIEDEVDNSDGSISTTRFKYPFDWRADEPYKTMVDKNILSPVVEQTEYIRSGRQSNQLVQKSVTDYRNWGNNLFAPQYIRKQTSNQSASEIRTTYHNYDSHGNPLYISKDGANNVVYLWGYKHQYPIAEIKNATYSEVETAVQSVFSVASMDTLSKLATPNETKLKDGSLQRALPNAMVTTYTYKPLVGVETITDPRGVKTTYEYDPFGRLETIRDENNKIIEDYGYHYKN